MRNFRNPRSALLALVAASVLQLPICSTAFAFGGADAGGLPEAYPSIAGEKFHFFCQAYAVRQNDVMAVKNVEISNSNYVIRVDAWEKFGLALGLSGSRTFREKAGTQPFAPGANDVIIFSKSPGSNTYRLIVRVLDESVQPPARMTATFVGDVRNLTMAGELLTGRSEDSAFGISCKNGL